MPEKPFPTSEGDIELFIENLAQKVPAEAGALGLTVADTTRLTNAAANFDYIRNVANQVKDATDSFFQFKDTMFYGDTTGTPAVPTFPAVILPQSGDPGIVPFTKSLIKRIKAAPAYTEQMGENFGFITNDSNSLVPADIVPTLTVRALNDGAIEIKFSKQGLDAMRIDWRKKGDTAWQLASVYTTSPGVHSAASPNNAPEAREYRGILLKKNEPVSQYSATYNVVTTP